MALKAYNSIKDRLPPEVVKWFNERRSQVVYEEDVAFELVERMGFVRGVYMGANRRPELMFTHGNFDLSRQQTQTIEDILSVFPEQNIQFNWAVFDTDTEGAISHGKDYRSFRAAHGMVERHYGPGPHPGTGTPQDVHGGGSVRAGIDGGSNGEWYKPDEHGPDWSSDPDVIAAVKKYLDQDDRLKKVGLADFQRGFISPEGEFYQFIRGGERAEHVPVAMDALMEGAGITAPQIWDKYGNLPWWGSFASREMRKMGYVDVVGVRSNSLNLRVEAPLPKPVREAIESLWYLLDEDKRKISITANPFDAYAGPGENTEKWYKYGPNYEIGMSGRGDEKVIKNDLGITLRHYGPGPHPGTGTPQDVHGHGEVSPLTNPPWQDSGGIWSESKMKQVMNFIEEEWNPTAAINLENMDWNFWLLPDGRLMDVREHGEVGPRLYREFGENLFDSEYNKKWESVHNSELKRQGFVRAHFHDNPASGIPTIFIEIDKASLNDKTRRAISDMYWAAYLPERGAPNVVLDWEDTSGDFHTISMSGTVGPPADIEDINRALGFKINRSFYAKRHYGPGPHPGTGTPQSVHGGGGATKSPIAKIENHVTESYSGQINGILIAMDENRQLLGHIEWTQFEGKLSVSMIEVEKEHRRKGIATAMWKALKDEFPEAGIEPFGNYATTEGQAFLDSLTNRHYGPGPHPGTGTPQDVHGGGRINLSVIDIPDDVREMRFFHATDSPEAAEEIMQTGIIKPGSLKQGRTQLAPVAGRGYATSDIEYALIYALGGNVAGSELSDSMRDFLLRKGRYGYIFEIDPESLGDIQPDEDWIGEAIDDQKYPWLDRMAERHLTKYQLQKVKSGEYAYWAQAGKKIAPHLSSEQIIEMIRDGAHIANFGDMKIKNTWILDKLGVANYPHQQYGAENTPENRERRVKQIWENLQAAEELAIRHYGPGPHPGTGTPQDVHGRGAPSLSIDEDAERVAAGKIRSVFNKNYPPLSLENARDANWFLSPEGSFHGGDIWHPEVADFVVSHALSSGERSINPVDDLMNRGFFRGGHREDSEIFIEIGKKPTREQIQSLDTLEYLTSDPLHWAYWIDGDRESGVGVRDLASAVGLGNVVTRHYGPGPHPGTGTSQDVHGGKGGRKSAGSAGLGEFKIGDPQSRNEIRFSIENIPSREQARLHLSPERIKALDAQFHQEVTRAIQDMESVLGFPISGLTITNDVLDLAVRSYGQRVLDDPNYRERTFGQLRAQALGWRGGYTKGLIWLDESMNTALGPLDMDSPTWQESVWHEVGHYLTEPDGRVGFSADFVRSMIAPSPSATPDFWPSQRYLSWVKESYGTSNGVIWSEYKADLVAAYVGSKLDGKPPTWRRRFTGLDGPLSDRDIVIMNDLMSHIEREGREQAGLTERQAPSEDDLVLVHFGKTGEVRGVRKAALASLPPSATVIGSVFES